jgi:uncharacterized protein YqfA (UPF0365 family)
MLSPLLIAIIVVALVVTIVLFNFIGIWVRAWSAGAPVGIPTMIAMRLRGVPVAMIVDSRITAVKAGLEIGTDPLEAHYLAGGNVNQVILALIAAEEAGIRWITTARVRSTLPRKGRARPCSRQCARASIRRSSTALRPPRERRRSTAWPRMASA